MPSRRIAALDIGGTHVTAALVDVTSWALVPGTVCRRSIDAQADADTVMGSILGAAKCAGAIDGTPWGIAIPGPFDYDRGIGLFSGVSKFDSLRGVDVGALLRGQATGIRDVIHFLNDAEAFAIGEWVAGAACGHSRVIATTLGTGVGSAFLVDGVAMSHGPGVPPEGRLDLLRIEGRPLERAISRAAIRARFAASTGSQSPPMLDVQAIVDLARDGSVDALDAIAGPVESLGRVLAPLVIAFGASVVVVGGGISTAWDIVQRHLRVGMDLAVPGWSRRCQLLAAQNVHEAALIGAAWSAYREITQASSPPASGPAA